MPIDLGSALPSPEILEQAESVEIVAREADAPLLETVLIGLRAARRLKSLCLRSRLGALPPALGDLTGLQHLEIVDPRLRGLPRAVGGLTRLRSLRIEAFHLASLPKTIGSLHKLRELSIDSHHLSRLPDQLQELEALRTLRLALRRVIVADWEEPAYFRPRFEQGLAELFTLLATLPSLSSLALAEPPGDGWCPEPIFQVFPPELASLPSLEVLTLEVSHSGVRLPLGTPGLERLRRIVAPFVRFDHREEELRAALPHTEIVRC